ncbi:hypothetical protein DAEQUDRAFT_769731 [Daedalea quercina L-15889]|uniref:Uncharacterized protein n=1 Tax=Daedalea quercina L-15889 TaxID=1314783 RepID=A0A165LG99_9APHY|nr:hypothetical protein DAEQUDRAFT_769731 [Daedalea quercina L-15889]
MGFFKRIFSLSSGRRKKDKRKQSHGPLVTDAEGRLVHSEDRLPDADATRLLRSASARWASTDAVQSLAPPSVNHLSVPASPAQSLQTLASSLKRSNTYTVQVYARKQHSCTEFPKANPRIGDRREPHTPRQTDGHQEIAKNHHDVVPPVPAVKAVAYTPRDDNRLRALRRDPSVLSLLNMYDNHGRLDEHAFSNSPPNSAPIQEGREQTKRGGSTLRQLLGDGDKGGEATEGDISWADRFLKEAGSAISSTSSLPLVTPDNADNAFIDGISGEDDFPGTSLGNSDEFAGNPLAISSLEVEVSGTSDALDPDQPIPIPLVDAPVIPPKTPQHANQVFGFLSERRRSVRSRAESAFGLSTTTLPQLDSESGVSRPSQPTSDSSPQTPSFEESHWQTQTNISHAEVKTATVMKLSTAPAAVIDAKAPLSAPVHQTEFPELQRARTGSSAHSALTHKSSIAQPTRIPRGPRPRRSKHSLDCDFQRSQPDLPLDLQVRLDSDTQAPGLRAARPYGPRATESSKSVDTFTAMPPRQHRRSASRISLVNDPTDDAEESAPPVPPKPVSSRSHRGAHRKKPPRVPQDEDKENSDVSPSPSPALARSKSEAMPGVIGAGLATPTRARSVFDARYRNELGAAVAPSPASSSELSPMAKDMMTNLRKQRLRTQNVARRSGRGLRSAS